MNSANDDAELEHLKRELDNTAAAKKHLENDLAKMTSERDLLLDLHSEDATVADLLERNKKLENMIRMCEEQIDANFPYLLPNDKHDLLSRVVQIGADYVSMRDETTDEINVLTDRNVLVDGKISLVERIASEAFNDPELLEKLDEMSRKGTVVAEKRVRCKDCTHMTTDENDRYAPHYCELGVLGPDEQVDPEYERLCGGCFDPKTGIS